MIRTMMGAQVEHPLKYPDRIALMVRWLQHNEAKIRQFDAGSIELHFSQDEVSGKISKASLDKPDT